jgi:uncharacterized integral membrane protein (TIGR00698 family)
MLKTLIAQKQTSGNPATALLIIAGFISLTGYIAPPIALAIGIVLAQLLHSTIREKTQLIANKLLKVSIVGLGFGIPLQQALSVSGEGLLLTIGSITFTLTTGLLLGKYLKVEKHTSFLIAAGTAICGGSAIAALAPVLKAKSREISIALGTIFTLNALALFIFPIIGEYFHISQSHFGLWAAIAIHDTSSVVGAAKTFGKEALEIATIVKLERALWVIPLVFILAFSHKKGGRIKLPWFILLFVGALFIPQILPKGEVIWNFIAHGARRSLTLTLLLIGAGLEFRQIKQVGWRPFIQGVVLWLGVGTVSFITIELML